MENSIQRNILSGTGYANEVHALGEQIGRASRVSNSDFASLSSRVLTSFGPSKPGLGFGEPLIIETNRSDASQMQSDELFIDYRPTGYLGKDDQQNITLPDFFQTPREQSLLITSRFERFRKSLSHTTAKLGNLATKAFNALNERLTPVPIDDQAFDLQTTWGQDAHELISTREQKSARANIITRAAAWVAIAGTVAALGAKGVDSYWSTDYETENTDRIIQVMDLKTDDTEKTADSTVAPDTTTTTRIATTTSTTNAPSTTTTTTAASAINARLVSNQPQNEVDCSITKINDAPIERVIHVAKYLRTNLGLSGLGADMLTGNGIQETGNLSPSAHNEAEDARGFGQWRGDRQIGMPTDLDGQLRFAVEIEMPRNGNAHLVQLLRSDSSTIAQIEQGLKDWELYGEKGLRTEYGRKVHAFMNNCVLTK